MIVCTQSSAFAAAIRFGGKVGWLWTVIGLHWHVQESKKSNIDLFDDEPAIVELLMRFLYTGDYRSGVQDSLLRPDPSIGAKDNLVFSHTCAIECSEYLCTHHRCGRNCRSNCASHVCWHSECVNVTTTMHYLTMSSSMQKCTSWPINTISPTWKSCLSRGLV